MFALLILIDLPLLALLWGLAFLALRWLRTGRPAPRWIRRRIRGRADAYGLAAVAGVFTAMLPTMPGSPWMNWFKTAGLARNPLLFFGPLVLFPACLLVLAVIFDRAGRRRTGSAPQ